MASYVNENIKLLRNRMGITQEKFAELIGINRKAIGSYEENRATPPLDKLNKIASLFGITLDQLTSHRFATDNSNIPLFVEEEEEEIHPEDIPLVVEKKKPFSRTGTNVFEPLQENVIRYVSYKYFDKYVVDNGFEKRIAELPGLNLPFYTNSQDVRAFDVPADSYLKEGVIIAERVLHDNQVVNDQYYLLISPKNGIFFKRISRTSYETFIIKGDQKGEKDFELNSTDIREIWKPVGFFSLNLPKSQIDISSLSSKINALKNDLDNLL